MAVTDNAYSTAMELTLKLQVTARTYRKALNHGENIKYSKVKSKFKLKKLYIEARLKYSTPNVLKSDFY